MGFDLYGLNPASNDKPDVPDFINDEDGAKAYFAWQDKTEGAYFRANVWYWRPIWAFVCGASDGIFTDKDRDYGNSNSGHRISMTKSKRIAARLRKLDKGGVIQSWEDEMMEHYNKAKKHNENVQKTLDAITKNCKKEHGDDIVPADYPEPYNTQWNEAYNQRDWGSSYPPSRKYIMEFANFAEHSGGFEIC